MGGDKKSPPRAVKAGIVQGNRASKYSHWSCKCVKLYLGKGKQ